MQTHPMPATRSEIAARQAAASTAILWNQLRSQLAETEAENASLKPQLAVASLAAAGGVESLEIERAAFEVERESLQGEVRRLDERVTAMSGSEVD